MFKYILFAMYKVGVKQALLLATACKVSIIIIFGFIEPIFSNVPKREGSRNNNVKFQ
jgi:hypothetical protein